MTEGKNSRSKNLRSTFASKINVTVLPPKGVNRPISKLLSISAVANLLAHNDISQICYCGQISLQSAAVNWSFSDDLISLGVTSILLAMVHEMFKNTTEDNIKVFAF